MFLAAGITVKNAAIVAKPIAIILISNVSRVSFNAVIPAFTASRKAGCSSFNPKSPPKNFLHIQSFYSESNVK